MKTPTSIYRLLILLIFLFSISKIKADNYFWVGGTGSWADYNQHWAISSGGQLYHNHVPTPNDTVIFDSLSFIGINDTVFADSSILYCYNMKWSNVQNRPLFINPSNGSNAILKIYGSLQLDTGMVWGFGGKIRMYGLLTGNTILSHGANFPNLEFCGDTLGSWQLLDSLNATNLIFSSGTFRTSGQKIICNNFIFAFNNLSIVQLDTSHLIIGNFQFRSAPQSFDADSSNIIYLGGLFNGGNQHYGKVFFPNTVEIVSNNLFEETYFDRSCQLITTNTFRKFVLQNPGNSIILSSAVQLNILDTLIASGSCRSMNAIFGSAGSAVEKLSGTVSIDQIVLDNVSANGGATFIATNSFSNGVCTGWILPSPVIPRTLFWVGGSGDWNDSAHWSAVSGGMPGECPPNPADDVIVDSASFLAIGDSLTSTLPNIFCNTFNWQDLLFNGNLNHSQSLLHDYQSFILQTNMNEIPGSIIFRGNNVGNLIDPATHSLGNLTFVGNGIWNFLSNVASSCRIDIQNGQVNTNGFLVACGSFIASQNSYVQFNSSYLNCSYCIFSQPTVILSPPAIVEANSFSDNTSSYFPELIFPGSGYLNANSSFGKTTFSFDAIIEGSNIFDTLQFLNTGTDISIQAGSSQQINSVLTMVSSCSDPIMFHSSNEGAQASFVKSSGNITVSDIIMQDINGTGGASFNALNTVAIANVSGWTVTPPPAGPMYWIGGTGNWNDPTHWSPTSGGLPGICVPNPLSDVYFDANSFTGNADSVKVNRRVAYCRNMDWSGSNGFPSFVDIINENLLKCYGSFIIDTNVTASEAYIQFRSVLPGNSVNSNNQLIGHVSFDGLGGGWILSGDLKAGNLEVNKGSFKTSGFTLDAQNVKSLSGNFKQIQLDSSFVYVGNWEVSDTSSLSLDASLANFVVNGNNFRGGNKQFYNQITFDNDVTLYDADTISFARFTKMVNLNNSIVFDTLFFDNPGFQVSIESGTTQTLRGTMFTSGTSNTMIGIESSRSCAPASIFKLQDTLCSEFLVLRGITATGGATFYAGYYSSDAGNNSGWQFQSCTPAMIDVWPGDANRDLITDNLDLLAVGIAFGQSKAARSNASNNYVAQPAWAWEILFANASDIVNADCDGDSIISFSDTTAISLNYGLTHPARLIAPTEIQTAGIPLYFDSPLLPVVPGDTTSVGIMLGDNSTSATNIYGIAFTLNYSTDDIVPGSVWIEFNNSWLAPTGSEIHILKHFSGTSTIEIAISRFNHQNRSGFGQIARLHFTLSPTATVLFRIWYTDVTLIDNNEIQSPTQNSLGGFPISLLLSSNEALQQGFNAYPNPTDGNYFIADSKIFGEVTEITVRDMTGRVVQENNTQGESKFTLHLEQLPAGTYFVQIKNEKGTFMERVVRE